MKFIEEIPKYINVDNLIFDQDTYYSHNSDGDEDMDGDMMEEILGGWRGGDRGLGKVEVSLEI